MAKYDWEKLRQKFVTTNTKCSLKQFAKDNNIPYGLLRQNAVGWCKERRTKNEQKTNKIIDKTIDKQIESDVEMNLRHYNLAGKLLAVIEKSIDMEGLFVSPKSINSIAKSLETTQKVQRIASGVENKDGGGNGDLIKDFMEAVVNESNDEASE